MTDVLDLSIVDVATQVQKGTLTARQVTEAALSRIDQTRDLNALLYVSRDAALAAADAVDAKRKSGATLGKLAGVPIAIATDHNPGSSPTLSPLLMLNMACVLFRLTPSEALRGLTVNGARALGLEDRGQLVAGQRADFCIWDGGHPRELAACFGHNPLKERIYQGQRGGQ